MRERSYVMCDGTTDEAMSIAARDNLWVVEWSP